MRSQQIRELRECFKKAPKHAVEMAKAMIVNDDKLTFSSWIYEEQACKIDSACSFTWSTPKFTVFCNTCGLYLSAPICMNCFTSSSPSKHEGHDLFFEFSKNGRCACGDSNSMDSNFFCSFHSLVPSTSDTVGSDHSDFVTDLADLCFKSLIMHAPEKSNNVQYIVDFLIELANINASYLHLIAAALSENFDNSALFTHWPHFSMENSLLITKLIETLSVDDIFRCAFTNFFHDNYIYLLAFDIYAIPILEDNACPTSTVPILSIANIAWSYLLAHDEMIEELCILDTIMKEVSMIKSFIKYDHTHPMVSQSLIRNFFSTPQIFFSNPRFFKMISQDMVSEKFEEIFTDFAELDSFPMIKKNYVNPDYTTRHVLGALNMQKNIFCALEPLIYNTDLDHKTFFFPLISTMLGCLSCDKLDKLGDTSKFYDRSVLADNIFISCSAPCHSVSFRRFCIQSQKGIDDWKEIFDNNPEFDDSNLLSMTTIPMRICAFGALKSLGVAKKGGGLVYDCFYDNADFSYDAIGCYAAAICALSFATNIGSLALITFRLFDLENQITSKKLFAYFNFFLCCISDRTVFIKEKDKLIKNYLKNYLATGAKSGSDILRKCDCFITKNSEAYQWNNNDLIKKKEIDELDLFEIISGRLHSFQNRTSDRCSRILIKQILDEITEQVSDTCGFISYKLRDELDEFCPSIFNSAMESFKQWSVLIRRYPKNAFAKVSYSTENKPSGFSPHSVLVTPEFYAILFITAKKAIEGKLEEETIHIFFSLLLYIMQFNLLFENNSEPIEAKHIKASNIKELASKLPDEFAAFQVAVIEYADYEAITFNELLIGCGEIGAQLFQQSKPMKPNFDLIYKIYEKKKLSYLRKFVRPFKVNGGEIHILVFEGFSGQQIWASSDQNGRFNASLPLLNQSFDENIKCQRYLDGFGSYNSQEKLFDIINNMIINLELRIRSHPFALDDFRPRLLVGNTFRLLWASYQQQNENQKFVQNTKLESFLVLFLKSKDPISSFYQILNLIWEKADDDWEKTDGYLFLRHAFIFAFCGLWLPDLIIPDSIFDPNSEKSFDDLCGFLKVNKSSYRFREFLNPFSFVDLPQNFIDFTEVPFVADVFNDTNNDIDNNNDSEDKNRGDIAVDVIIGDVEKIEGEIDQRLTVLICLSGKKAGTCYVSNPRLNVCQRIESLYLTKFGDDGTESGEFLFLNEDRVIRAEDAFLSGELFL